MKTIRTKSTGHPGTRRHLPALDGLRCAAAFGVVFFHIGSVSGPSHQVVAYLTAFTLPSVIIFFTISGFLVYRPYAHEAVSPPEPNGSSPRRPHYRSEVLRRGLRILPLYWTVLAVSELARTQSIFGIRLGASSIESPTDLVQAVFLLPFPHPRFLLTGPLGIAMWTLAIELPFHLLSPLYAAGLESLHRKVAPSRASSDVQLWGIGAILAVLAACVAIFGPTLAFPLMSLPIGMLLAIFEARSSARKRRHRLLKAMSDYWGLCLALYVGLALVAANLALDAYRRPEVTDPFAAVRSWYLPIQLAQAVLLFVPIAFGARRSLMVRSMGARPLLALAPLTYGIYLWHVPVLRYVKDWFGTGYLGFPIPATRGFGAPTLLIVITLATVTFFAVETPVARLRSSLRRNRTLAARRREPIRTPTPSRSVTASATGATAARSRPRSGRSGRGDPRAGRLVADATPNGSKGSSAPPVLATPWCQPLDGFRAIAVCLAVAGHTFLSSAIIPFSGALHVLGILVATFFAISAYVLYQPFLEADVRRIPRAKPGGFYARRLLRIYPLYALALTMYLLILPALRPQNLWGYARLYLFLQIFGRELSGLKGLPSAWYLCNEVIFYLAMPVMAFAAARWSNNRGLRSPAQRLRAHLFIGWGMVVLGPSTRTLLYVFKVPAPTSLPFSHLEFFGFGVVIAAYSVGTRLGIQPPSPLRWIRDHTAAAYTLVLIPVAMLAGIAERWGNGSGLWTEGNLEDRLRFFPYLMAIMLLMTAATLGSPADGSNRWLSSARFKPLSGLALHIYLWHQLVLGIMNKVFDGMDTVSVGPRFVTGAILVACAIGGSFLVARLSQPFTDWPYEKYRAVNGRLRGRGATPQPSRQRPIHPKVLEPHPS